MNAQLALAICLLASSVCAISYGFAQFQKNRAVIRKLISYRITARGQIQKRRMELYELRNRARLLEDTVAGSASAVEKMHRVIAHTTFSLVDRFSKDDELRHNAQKARKTHDRATRQVYNAVRTTNRAIHVLADSLLITKAEKRVILKKNTATTKNNP